MVFQQIPWHDWFKNALLVILVF